MILSAFHDFSYPILFFILEPKTDIEKQQFWKPRRECTFLFVMEQLVVFGFSLVFLWSFVFNLLCFFLLEASFTKIAVTASLEVASEVIHVTHHPRKYFSSEYPSSSLLMWTEHVCCTGELHEMQEYIVSRLHFFALHNITPEDQCTQVDQYSAAVKIIPFYTGLFFSVLLILFSENLFIDCLKQALNWPSGIWWDDSGSLFCNKLQKYPQKTNNLNIFMLPSIVKKHAEIFQNPIFFFSTVKNP